MFADAGIEDIRLPYPLNPVNAPRVLALLDRTQLSFIVDHLDVARGWSEAMTAAGRRVDVLVKVDVGFHRCGIDPAASRAADFVATVVDDAGPAVPRAPQSRRPRLPRGLGGRRRADRRRRGPDDAASWPGGVRAMGVAVDEISVGATPTARFSVERSRHHRVAARQLRLLRSDAGRRWEPRRWDDCALTVLARVVTRPAADRIILDCGSKTLTTDVARGCRATPRATAPCCLALDDTHPDESLLVERLSEEHATVKIDLGLVGAGTGRARPRRPEPFVRGLEPGRRGLAGGRRDGAGPGGCLGARPDCVVD